MIQVLHLSYRWHKFLVSLLTSIQSIVSVSGRISPHSFEMLFISPQQAYSFRCWFFQQLRSTLLLRMPFQALCGRSWHFLLQSFFLSNDLSSILSPRGLVMFLCSLLISVCQDHVQFLPFIVEVLSKLYQSYSFSMLFNRSVVFSFKFNHLIKFCLLPQPEGCPKSFIPFVPFFH